MSGSDRSVRLRDGNAIPQIGLGTHGAPAGAITSALYNGYRLIDTATSYGNEAQVGEELRGSGVDRIDVQIVTKLPGRQHGFRETVAACRASRRKLGVDYLDLYLIHWPNPHLGRYVESWRAMIELREMGLVRSIGVSNFIERHIEDLVTQTGVVPVVNQIEVHPNWRQDALRRFHDDLGIVTQAWSPLGHRDALFRNRIVERIARRHGITSAQVVLQWHRRLAVVPLPRSSNEGRQRENLVDVGELDEADLEELALLPQGRLWASDPALFRDEWGPPTAE